jgi:hypothetical protein
VNGRPVLTVIHGGKPADAPTDRDAHKRLVIGFIAMWRALAEAAAS